MIIYIFLYVYDFSPSLYLFQSIVLDFYTLVICLVSSTQNTHHNKGQFSFIRLVMVALFRLYYVILLSLLIVNMYYLFHVNCSLGLLADGQTEDGLIIVAGGYHCVGSH